MYVSGNNNRNQKRWTASFLFKLWAISILQIPQFCQPQIFPANNTNNNNNPSSSDICKRLASSSSSSGINGAETILTIGMLPTGILVITSTFYVFSLKTSQIKDEIEQLYLPDQPIPMQTKWPVLYSDRRFQTIKDFIFNSFTVSDGSSQYVMFTVRKQDHPNVQGVTYDIGESKVYDGLTYDFQNYQALLSTNIQLTFYALQKSSTGNKLQIETLKFLHTPITTSSIGIAEQFRPFCYQPGHSDSIYIGKSVNEANCQPVNWPVMKGFIGSSKFYLFGPQNVIIFDQSVYTSSSSSSQQPVKIRLASYDTFINCGNDNNAGSNGNDFKSLGTDGTDGNTNSKVGIWIGVMLFILLLVALIIFFLCRGGKQVDRPVNASSNVATSSSSNTAAANNNGNNRKESEAPSKKSRIGAGVGSAPGPSQSGRLNRSSTKAHLSKRRSTSNKKLQVKQSKTNANQTTRSPAPPPLLIPPVIIKSSTQTNPKSSRTNTKNGLKTIPIASRLKNPSQMLVSGSNHGTNTGATPTSSKIKQSLHHNTNTSSKLNNLIVNNRISSLNYSSNNNHAHSTSTKQQTLAAAVAVSASPAAAAAPPPHNLKQTSNSGANYRHHSKTLAVNNSKQRTTTLKK